MKIKKNIKIVFYVFFIFLIIILTFFLIKVRYEEYYSYCKNKFGENFSFKKILHKNYYLYECYSENMNIINIIQKK